MLRKKLTVMKFFRAGERGGGASGVSADLLCSVVDVP